MTAALPLPPSDDSLSSRLASEIRAELARRRGTKDGMRKALGWSHGYITRRLTGEAPLDMNDLEKIAGYFGMTVIELISTVPESGEVRPFLRSTPTESTRQYLLETDCTVLTFPLVRRRNAA